MQKDAIIHYGLRIPRSLRLKLAVLAKQQRRSAHAQTVYILEQATLGIEISEDVTVDTSDRDNDDWQAQQDRDREIFETITKTAND